MNQQTWKEYKVTHPKATVEQWLEAHRDKRPNKMPKRVDKPHKKRGLVRGE